MAAEPSANSTAAAVLGPWDRPAAELRRWAAGTLVGLLWCAALLIGWRRLAGTISIPLQPALLLAVGALVAVTAAGVRLARRCLPAQPESSWPDRRKGDSHLLPERPATNLRSVPGFAQEVAVAFSVLGLGAALSLPGTDPWGLAAFWVMLVGEESWAWRPATWRRPPGGREARPLWRRVRVGAAEEPAAHGSPTVLTDGVPADDVLQQLTRSQAPDGSEQLCGWLRAPFAEGQRTATVHLAFCPQFARTPELTVQQHGGPEILRINQTVFSFGARLDLKLSAAAEGPLDVVLRFSARSKPPAPAVSARQRTP